MLVISNRSRASLSSEFEITRAITPWIVLHSVQLLVLFVANCDVIDGTSNLREFTIIEINEWFSFIVSQYSLNGGWTNFKKH